MTGARMLALALSLAGCSAALAQEAGTQDLAELAQLPVYGASRHYVRQVDAPASVSIITAEDIRSFGYRTLGDILRSVRGVSIHNDRTYDFLALRGFARPGDYNAGVSLQIDGMRINDALYDQALLGAEFPLDVELIERVEYIRSPGSAEYGGNAVFGVINVVTRSGSSIGGARLTLEAGSDRRFATRGQFGRRFANGAGVLVSASSLGGHGETLDFRPIRRPAFPVAGAGRRPRARAARAGQVRFRRALVHRGLRIAQEGRSDALQQPLCIRFDRRMESRFERVRKPAVCHAAIRAQQPGGSGVLRLLRLPRPLADRRRSGAAS
ncbi:MAG: TonB-dependent receptor plug domain-containing protein [Sterolibacteriaceae bacterium]|nr:TonB-dependent receptor plug domain-containing protein [Candidatus Methylophosphatis haderslevensis]